MSFFFLYSFAAANVKLVKGHTICIPSYSNIISESYCVVLGGNIINHNTDTDNSISIVKIDHYDINGKLVELEILPELLPQKRGGKLCPDSHGGSGLISRKAIYSRKRLQ